MSRKILTLCLAQNGSKILLAMKKRGFGANRWNGMGGKVEKGETIEQAAIRECREEAGIEIESLERSGVLKFEFAAKLGEILEVHLFRIKQFSGEPMETEEMKPQWFSLSDIPYDSMWPDDQHWLPLFLAGKRMEGYFLFGENNVILKQEIEEWKDYPAGAIIPVVNCVVRYNGKMLLVQRSSNVKYYPLHWNGISGFLTKPTAEEQVKKEIKEELGLLADHIISINPGSSFEQRDGTADRIWQIHPMRVELNTDRIELDWEAQDHRWIEPMEAKTFHLVPGFEKVMAAFNKTS